MYNIYNLEHSYRLGPRRVRDQKSRYNNYNLAYSDKLVHRRVRSEEVYVL